MKNEGNWRAWILKFSACLLLCNLPQASATTINFDSLSDSEIVTNQFSGLTFSNTIVLTAGISLNEFEFPPRSNPNVVSDNGGPITITFGTPVQSVSGYFTYGVPLTVAGFDSAGAPVAIATSMHANNLALSGDPGSSPNELITVFFAGGISKIIISGNPLGSSFTLDDLTYPATSLSTSVPIYLRYVSNLTNGDSVINITNTGANGASLNGPGFGAPVGNLCVNVYAFSPDEQLVSCCSCLITPNGLVHLTANNDLVSNTLTGLRPNSLMVKLLPTGAGSAFNGNSCANSAALAGTPAFPLATGVLAWGTTIHSASSIDPPPAGSLFSITETPFLPATLGLDEVLSITNRCSSIIGNGSTFGQCRSCRLGGLGGAKL